MLSTSLAKLQAKPKSATQPNVVLILTDDQGWGDVGYNGNTQLRTPHIDQLARESTSFDQFTVYPSCSPTRAGLM
ncbi:UNVERIFIED_CONTAM: hypothetical protein GTU68_060297, partial [Idotea baltica]|nr:hypothetical protein [Idotea baltica]